MVGALAEFGEDFAFAVGEGVETAAGGGVGGEGLGEASDEAAGDGGVEERAAVGDGAHRRGEVFGRDVLEDEAAGAGLEGPVDVFVGVEGRQDDDLEGPVGLFEDGSGGGKAVHFRHADVHQDDVGSVLAGGVDGFEAVAGFGDDVDVGLVVQDHGEAATHEGLVVDDDDADGHVLLQFEGDAGLDTEVVGWLGLGGEGAAEEGGAFAHAGDAVSGCGESGRRGAGGGVGDVDDESEVVEADGDVDGGVGSGVFDDVGERFLDDAVGGEVDGGREAGGKGERW